MDVLRSYDISLNQIYTLTVDNGRNIVRAGSILNNKALEEENNDVDWELEDEELEIDLCHDAILTIRCACHMLQMAVKDFLVDVGEFLPAAREVCKKLRTPTINNILKGQKLQKAILDCRTRWGSTFLMCQRLLQLKNFCEESSNDIEELHLRPSQWTKLADVFSALSPVHEVTLKLQRADLTASEFYFSWYSCRKKIERKSGRYCHTLLKHLKVRGESILYAEPILACVYLDPRFQILLTSEQKEVAKLHLNQLLKRKHNVESVCIDNSSPSICSMNSSFSTDDSEQFLKQLDNCNSSCSSTPIINVIETFNHIKREPHNTNVFDYWAKQSIKELKELAQIVLAIPATQVSVERAFSTVKFILSDQRASIDENVLEDILLLNLY